MHPGRARRRRRGIRRQRVNGKNDWSESWSEEQIDRTCIVGIGQWIAEIVVIEGDEQPIFVVIGTRNHRHMIEFTAGESG